MSAKPVKKPMAAIAPFGLRMQPDMKERIEKAAEANNRSMNAEIIARLEMSFSELAAGAAVSALVADQSELLVRQAELIERQGAISESVIETINQAIADALEKMKLELIDKKSEADE